MPLPTKNNISRYTLIGILWMLPLFLVAQGDSLQVQPRGFAQESIEKYKADTDFDYDREVPLQTQSLWERLKRWLIEKFFSSFSSENRSLEQTLFYVVLAVLVVFIILKLANVNLYNVFRGAAPKGKREDLAYASLTEQIYEADLDKLVQEAIGQAKYEQALRLLFLKTLRLLAEKKYIQWREPKTNGEYLRELAAHPALQKDFQQLRLWFDYTFYGDFHLDEVRFHKLQPLFQSFYQKL